MNDLKELFLQAPESQLDASMKALIQEWDEPPTSIQILEVIDKTIYGSLGSEFAVSALRTMYDGALRNEGQKHEDVVKQATWRTR